MNSIDTKKRDAIVEAWDSYQAKPENRYLKPTAMIYKICAALDTTYPTAVRALEAAGRYHRRGRA